MSYELNEVLINIILTTYAFNVSLLFLLLGYRYRKVSYRALQICHRSSLQCFASWRTWKVGIFIFFFKFWSRLDKDFPCHVICHVMCFRRHSTCIPHFFVHSSRGSILEFNSFFSRNKLFSDDLPLPNPKKKKKMSRRFRSLIIYRRISYKIMITGKLSSCWKRNYCYYYLSANCFRRNNSNSNNS